jgi:hypothetical protein
VIAKVSKRRRIQILRYQYLVFIARFRANTQG